MAADVPADGPVRLGSVQLPAGRRLSGWGEDAPRLWAASEAVPDAGQVWQALTDMHPGTVTHVPTRFQRRFALLLRSPRAQSAMLGATVPGTLRLTREGVRY